MTNALTLGGGMVGINVEEALIYLQMAGDIIALSAVAWVATYISIPHLELYLNADEVRTKAKRKAIATQVSLTTTLIVTAVVAYAISSN